MTYDQIAASLGISKTTVSRAISGKGRVSDSTREKVMDFISRDTEEIHVISSRIKKDNNIAVIVPSDSVATNSPFFHEAVFGVSEAATEMGFHTMVSISSRYDSSEIKQLIHEKIISGVVLLRSVKNDKILHSLAREGFPTGMIGTCDYKEIIQVDTDAYSASKEMTSFLISRGYKKFAVVLGDMEYVVNEKRALGFMEALHVAKISTEKQHYIRNFSTLEPIRNTALDLLSNKVECVVCGDDVICTRLMSGLQAEGYHIPKDIAIASLYNSTNLECFSPSVTAVNFSAREMGRLVANNLINKIKGEKYVSLNLLNHELILRKSVGYLERK